MSKYKAKTVFHSFKYAFHGIFVALKSQRKELEEEKKKEDLNELYSIITESGKSIDEVKSMILGK